MKMMGDGWISALIPKYRHSGLQPASKLQASSLTRIAFTSLELDLSIPGSNACMRRYKGHVQHSLILRCIYRQQCNARSSNLVQLDLDLAYVGPSSLDACLQQAADIYHTNKFRENWYLYMCSQMQATSFKQTG